MREGSKSKVASFFGSRTFVLIFSGLFLVAVFGFGRAYFQDFKIKQEIRQLEQEVKHLERKKIESLKILQYVSSQDFVEETARTELNLREPGEQVLVMARDSESIKNQQTAQENSQHLNNPTKWWYYFLH